MRRPAAYQPREVGTVVGPHAERQEERGVCRPDILCQRRDVYGHARDQEGVQDLVRGVEEQPGSESPVGHQGGRNIVLQVPGLRPVADLLRHGNVHHKARLSPLC